MAAKNVNIKGTKNDSEKKDYEKVTRYDVKTTGCIFQWKIDGASQSWWLKGGQYIESPKFIADGLDGTKWSLWLYPIGQDDTDYIDLYLHREMDCSGPDAVQVEFNLAFLNKHGSYLKETTGSGSFERGTFRGFADFQARDTAFFIERGEFLPNDTLTVQCTLHKAELKFPVTAKHLYAQTVLNTIRESFDWRIDKFSTFQPGVRRKFKNDFIEFDVVLNEEMLHKKLSIYLIFFHKSIQYLSCNTSVIDSDGMKETWRFNNYFINDLKKGLNTMTSVPRKFIVNKKRYLPGDVLSLRFDTVLSTIENSDYREDSAKGDLRENYENMAVLVEDFKSMYNDHILSDMELRTAKKTFQAHKNILSARSPVFRRMFSHDMKEKNSGHVDITDLDEDTIHQMLLYMYTGFLGGLQFESASKLYVAADKYEIQSLKFRCSSFLKGSLCSTTACDILILADLHQDEDLKNAVQVYMLEHDEVFRSTEWKNFMDTHVKLAADIMFKKINRDKI